MGSCGRSARTLGGGQDHARTPESALEISIQARLCNDSQYHSVGMWVVKGFYFGPTQSGERDLYYILSEATALAHPFDSV